jgi:hypothetical protein
MRGRPAAHRPVAARIGSGLSLPASGRGGKSSFSVQVTQRMGQAQVCAKLYSDPSSTVGTDKGDVSL